MHRIRRAWGTMLAVAPWLFVGISGYYLFFVIVPFFVLGIHRTPMEMMYAGHVRHEDALGVPANLVAVFLTWVLPSFTYLWALALVSVLRQRRWHVLAGLLVAPLPIAYVQAGPYAQKIGEWILPI